MITCSIGSLCIHSSDLPCVPECVRLGRFVHWRTARVPAQTSCHWKEVHQCLRWRGRCACVGCVCVCVCVCGVVWLLLVCCCLVDCRRCVVCCTLTLTPDVETSFGYLYEGHGYSCRLSAHVSISHHVHTWSCVKSIGDHRKKKTGKLVVHMRSAIYHEWS